MQKGLLDLSYMFFCLSVRLFTWNNSIHTSRIFMKFDIRGIFENKWKKFKFN